MTSQTAAVAADTGNVDDADYATFLARFNVRFQDTIANGVEPLFTTDAEGLFEAYLQGFPEEGGERQHHNCHACRHFIERFGSLVTIDEKGIAMPALFHGDGVHPHYALAFAAMARIVRKAKVTGVFLSAQATLGSPITGAWRHLSVTLPKSMLHTIRTRTAGQAMAEKREDFINVSRALAEFPTALTEQALALLKTETLYQSERVIGPARWLHQLHEAREGAVNRTNVTWRAVALAPAGFCHPRSSMVGTLLEDLAAGMKFEEVARRFASKMHPLQYQRPQAAPAAGAIAQAEKVVEQLGAAGSLARRFARPDEITDTVWRAKPRAEANAAGGSVFGHLKAKGAPEIPLMDVPAITITWEKFSRSVLPEAESIEFHARAHADHYAALVTAANPEAPPILQWDSVERRNPFSWYVWTGGSSPEQWGLRCGGRFPVYAITLQPSMWGDTEGRFAHHGAGAIFLIEGASETVMAGAALFPALLKSEFHGIRSVIEAYSKTAQIAGLKEPMACGIKLSKGHRWNHLFTVTAKGRRVSYLLDRWD